MNLAILDGICIYPTRTGQRAFCPECGGAVMSKVGEVKEAHWAHLVETNCEGYYKPMTEWHRSWQAQFPKEWREIYTKKDGEVCIADVKTPRGTTIEFQHSPISKENIAKRKRVHGDVFWVLDASTYEYFMRMGTESHYNSVKFDFVAYENNGFEDIDAFIRNHKWLKHTKYTKTQLDNYNSSGYKYKFNIEFHLGENENIKYCYRVVYSFIEEMFEAKEDTGFMNGTEFQMLNGKIKINIFPLLTIKHCLYVNKFSNKFKNASGVFMDNVKNIADDSLLQLFSDGTFKIFKKEGFIQKLLSHSQTN